MIAMRNVLIFRVFSLAFWAFRCCWGKWFGMRGKWGRARIAKLRKALMRRNVWQAERDAMDKKRGNIWVVERNVLTLQSSSCIGNEVNIQAVNFLLFCPRRVASVCVPCGVSRLPWAESLQKACGRCARWRVFCVRAVHFPHSVEDNTDINR